MVSLGCARREGSRDIGKMPLPFASSVINAESFRKPALQTNSTFTEGECGWGGDGEGNKVETTKTKTPFYNRTYNVLEATSTNTTSTSVWSLTNSWMQYITLTLPCIYPGQQGPERGTHWVGSGQEQGLRSPNLTVVCKKGSGCGDCTLSAFQMTQMVKWSEKTLQVVRNDNLTL